MKVKFYKELQSILKQSRFDSLYTWQNNRQDELDKVDPNNLGECYQLLADQQLVFLDFKKFSTKDINRLKTTLLSLSDILLHLNEEIEDNYLQFSKEDADKYCKVLFKLLQREVDSCFNILEETTWCRQRNFIDEFGRLGSAYDISLTESIEEVADIDLLHLSQYPDTKLPADSLELYAWYTAAVYLVFDNAQYTQRKVSRLFYNINDNKRQDCNDEQELFDSPPLNQTEQPNKPTELSEKADGSLSFVEEGLGFMKGQKNKHGILIISDSDYQQLVLLTKKLFSAWEAPDIISIKIYLPHKPIFKAYNWMLNKSRPNPTVEQRRAVVIFLLKLFGEFELFHLEGDNYKQTTVYKKLGEK